MNKTELIRHIAATTGVSQRVTERVLDSAMLTIADMLAIGEKTSLVGFGTFEPRIRSAKVGHMPITNEKITIPQYICAFFRPSEKLKEYINKDG